MAGVTTIDMEKAIANIVGADAVSTDSDTLREFVSSLGPVPDGTPLCVVRPQDAEQVRSVVKLANEKGLNLVPVSSGAPHLRGASVPSGEGVIIDLSRMNGIVRVDAFNRVAIIEPGVTIARLKAAAAEQGLKPFLPLYPRFSKSALASCLEREPITIPKYHWDMPDPLLCTELVFGSGELFRTGSAAGPGNLEQQWEQGLAQRNPMGPANTDFARVVQGSQGTMAVATWGSVKLGPLPLRRNLHFISDSNLNKLIDFSYRMFRVKYADEFLTLNPFALGAMLYDNVEDAKAFAQKQAGYVLAYCVAGYRRLADERVAYQEKGIAEIAQQFGVEPRDGIAGVSAAEFLRLLDGPCPDPYWKVRLQGGFRDIFFLTTLDRVPAFITLMEELAATHAYPLDELGVYIQPIQQGHTCHLEFNLFYDPLNDGQAKVVEQLFAQASEALSAAGGFFSRPYGPWAATAYARCPDTVEALRKVKQMLDPNGVMNRGKLCFGGE